MEPTTQTPNPHFYLSIPKDLMEASNEEVVERYAGGAGILEAAIAGLTHAQLVSYPVAETWSIQQIVVHLMDTDQIASYRWKRIIAEERPKLDVYDENAFVAKLYYDRQDASMAASAFRLNRLMTANLLRRLSPDDFERTADHPEVGPIVLGFFVRLYVHHLNHHLAFLRRKRAMVQRGADPSGGGA